MVTGNRKRLARDGVGCGERCKGESQRSTGGHIGHICQRLSNSTLQIGAVCCTSIILQLRFLLKAKTWNIPKKDKSGEVLVVWVEGVLRKPKKCHKGSEDIRENA